GLASRVGGARPAWENVVAQTETGAGVLRPRWRFQRTRRRDQRTVGTPTRHRPRLPQLRPLRPALPDPLRTTHRENQSTLKPEEPLIAPTRATFGKCRFRQDVCPGQRGASIKVDTPRSGPRSAPPVYS